MAEELPRGYRAMTYGRPYYGECFEDEKVALTCDVLRDSSKVNNYARYNSCLMVSRNYANARIGEFQIRPRRMTGEP